MPSTPPVREQLAALWDAAVPTQVNWNMALPDETLIDQLEASVSRYAEQGALDFFGKQTSYRELGIAVENVAARLREIGVGPWPGGPAAWPTDERYDPELLSDGDRRNVGDEFRYWTVEAIVAELDTRRHPFHVAIENWGHDLNIGSVVRTANAFNAAAVHIVGRRRWNRRGAMVTDRYQRLCHHDGTAALLEFATGAGLTVVAVDNVPGSVRLEEAALPLQCLLAFGQEGPGLSAQAQSEAQRIGITVARELGVTGVLAVEVFAVETPAPVAGGPVTTHLYVNELAMRPHNSGHWTQDGAVTSQFAQHLRAVLDLPLGSAEPTAPVTVMANLLGGSHEPGPDALARALAQEPRAHVHLYGKGVRPRRKLGHVNLTGRPGEDVAGLRERARAVVDVLRGDA